MKNPLSTKQNIKRYEEEEEKDLKPRITKLTNH